MTAKRSRVFSKLIAKDFPKAGSVNSRFLLPAGYLPKIAPYSIFREYENLRSGKYSKGQPLAAGFEYYYMVDQDAEEVNRSPIGGKIIGVHGPWTGTEDIMALEAVVMSRLVFKPPVAKDLSESLIKTVKFAHNVGAKYVVVHTIDLDFDDPEKTLEFISREARRQKIMVFLEEDIKEKFGIHGKWVYDIVNAYQRFKIPLVFDPATTEANKRDIIEEWRRLVTLGKGNINEVVGHVHLNEYQPGLNSDQGEMKTEKYARLLELIKSSGYRGYFTFEVSPIQSLFGKIMSGFYALLCLSGVSELVPFLTKTYAGMAKEYLYKSIMFSEKYLS